MVYRKTFVNKYDSRETLEELLNKRRYQSKFITALSTLNYLIMAEYTKTKSSWTLRIFKLLINVPDLVSN